MHAIQNLSLKFWLSAYFSLNVTLYQEPCTSPVYTDCLDIPHNSGTAFGIQERRVVFLLTYHTVSWTHIEARFGSGGRQCRDFLLQYFSDDEKEEVISCMYFVTIVC